VEARYLLLFQRNRLATIAERGFFNSFRRKRAPHLRRAMLTFYTYPESTPTRGNRLRSLVAAAPIGITLAAAGNGR